MERFKLLTGLPAGEFSPQGAYPERSTYGKVAKRLNAMAEVMMERHHLPLPHEID